MGSDSTARAAPGWHHYGDVDLGRRCLWVGKVTVENEDEVWSLLDLVVCLVIDDETLRRRLSTRTTNQFGKHPDELQAGVGWNRNAEARYRGFGARIVDATQRLELVISELLLIAGAASLAPLHNATVRAHWVHAGGRRVRPSARLRPLKLWVRPWPLRGPKRVVGGKTSPRFG